jgi:hypothetical protein
VSRTLGLPLLLVTLLIGGYLFTKQMGSTGPTSPVVTQAEAQAQAAGAAMSFQTGDIALQAAYAENSTYAGTALPPGSGAILVRADTVSYCLQTAPGVTPVAHEAGPNGSVQPGPC